MTITIRPARRITIDGEEYTLAYGMRYSPSKVSGGKGSFVIKWIEGVGESVHKSERVRIVDDVKEAYDKAYEICLRIIYKSIARVLSELTPSVREESNSIHQYRVVIDKEVVSTYISEKTRSKPRHCLRALKEYEFEVCRRYIMMFVEYGHVKLSKLPDMDVIYPMCVTELCPSSVYAKSIA